MPLVLKDRVKETTTTTGTGTITLAGAVSGYQSFSVIGNANTTYYTIVDTSTGAWEVGIGTYTAAGTTLSRDTVLESSNSGSLVNFGAGTKDVFVTYPAERAVVSGDTAYLSIPAPSTTGNVLTSNGTAWTSAPPSGGGGSTLTIVSVSAPYTVTSADSGKILNVSAGVTISLTAAATLGAGFNCWIWNTSANNFVTIDPNASETIDGVATLDLKQGEGTQIVCLGTAWQTGDKKTMRSYSENLNSTVTRPQANGANSIALGASSSGVESLSFSGSFAVNGGRAGGTDSFAAMIGNATSSYGTTNSNAVAIGRNALASGSAAVAIGQSTTASGASSLSLQSQQTTVSGPFAVSVCSYLSSNTANYGFLLPSESASVTQQYGMAQGYYGFADSIGKFARGLPVTWAKLGAHQTASLGLVAETSSSTPVVMTCNGVSPSTNNQLVIPNYNATAFSGIIVARQISSGVNCAAFKIEGLLHRFSNTTTLVASTVTAISNTPGWAVSLAADTTTRALAVSVTGAAAATVRWVANIQTAEVGF